MSKGWDSNMLKKLKSLIGKGLSTAEMGKKLGMSKNAVVGKLNRLGWNTKASEQVAKKTKTNDKTSDKKTSAAKPTKAKKDTAAKPAAKKTTSVKQTSVVVEKKPAKEKTVKTVAKPVKKAEKEQQVSEKTVIKTASKKTKKDLALHELLIQHALQMASLKPNQCRWPIGDPDSNDFHFCGETVFSGKPYCYEHCRQAYQFTPPKKK